MIDKLDNANVLMLSKKGSYGSIEVLGMPEEEIKVYYLAICRYFNDKGIYLFLCDEKMSVEQDAHFDSIDEARSDAQRRSKEQIEWEYPNGGQ